MKKKYFAYTQIVIVFSLITFFVSFAIEKDPGYTYIPLIPLCYIIMFIIFKKIHYYSKNYNGIFLLNIFMFIKYVVAVLLICVFKNFSVPKYYAMTISNLSYYYATILIIFEMITIFFAIELFADKIYKKNVEADDASACFSKYKIGLILFIFICISIILILLNRNSFIEKSLIIFSDSNSLNETIEANNYLFIIFNVFKTIMMGIIINNCIVKYEHTKRKRYIVYSYLTICLYVFLNISTSRLNIILPLFFFIFLTTKKFGSLAKKLNIACIVLLLLVFSSVSKYKNPWQYDENSKIYQSVINFSTGIQEYTSNIMPTAMGLQAIQYYNDVITIETFANDLFGSVPLISHMFNQDNRIYKLYNDYALKKNTMSQLIPMTVSSAAYFSAFFCWLLIFINVLLLMYFDNRSQKKKKTFLDEYLSIYLLFIFASCLYSNVQMLSGRFFVNYLPVFLIVTIDRKILMKKEWRKNLPNKT